MADCLEGLQRTAGDYLYINVNWRTASCAREAKTKMKEEVSMKGIETARSINRNAAMMFAAHNMPLPISKSLGANPRTALRIQKTEITSSRDETIDQSGH